MHIADVNNDGLTEYLWVSTSGSGGYSGVNGIYQEKGDGFVQVPFYSDYEPSDIPDHFAEPILTKACGTVYMGFYEEGVPVKYLWKDDKFRRACDEATTAEIEGNFKKAYRSKKYDLAYKTARYLHQACDTLPEKRFWRLNDMAVSAYHTSMPPDVCLGHLEAARNMTDYVKSNAKAAVALKTNEALCTAKPKR